MSEPLDYATPRPPRPRGRANALATAAFAFALLGCPAFCIIPKTRPFWSGHALFELGQVLSLIPWYACPALSVALALAVLGTTRRDDEHRRGRDLAMVAMGISLTWFAVMAAMYMIAARIGGIGPRD